MSARSACRGAADQATASLCATVARSRSPSVSRFARSAVSAARSRSTNVQCAAPRDNASMPSAPDPANRSMTSAPSTMPIDASELNIASRTMSVVGRVVSPSGATNRRPRNSPATTRIGPRLPAPRRPHRPADWGHAGSRCPDRVCRLRRTVLPAHPPTRGRRVGGGRHRGLPVRGLPRPVGPRTHRRRLTAPGDICSH